MRRFLASQWFLLALVVVLAAGFLAPQRLQETTNRLPKDAIVFAVMLVMALPIDSRQIWSVVSRPKAALLATAINLAFVPLLGWGASGLLHDELATGLLIVCSLPSTLASAAVWTRRAGGNDAVAVLVTMLTNLACFVVTPAWLYVTTHKSIEGQWRWDKMVLTLALCVALPIVLAQAMRRVQLVGEWTSRHKLALSNLAQCGVLTMLLVGSVDAGVKLAAHGGSESLAVGDWGMMLLAVVAIHVAALALGHVLAAGLGLSRFDRIAVGFSGSQKTIAAGLSVAITFYGGLAILPMVAYHVCQLVVDTLVVEKLRRK